MEDVSIIWDNYHDLKREFWGVETYIQNDRAHYLFVQGTTRGNNIGFAALELPVADKIVNRMQE